MKTDKDKNSEEDKVGEPEVAFKTIQVFDSFEEQEVAEMEWLASQTPEQHLQHAVSLIKRIFAEELRQEPEIGNQLQIK